MVKIEAVIQPFKLDEVKTALEGLGIESINVSEVESHGCRNAPKAFYRGAAYQLLSRRIKIEMLVSSPRTDEVVEALARAAGARTHGCDGTIVVYQVADAIGIRGANRLEFALA